MNEETHHTYEPRDAEPAPETPRTRREFARRTLACLTTAALAPSFVAHAQTVTPAPREAVAPPNPQATPAPADAALLDAHLAVARARFGEHLSAEELARLRTDLAGNLRASVTLSRTKLANADEPDFIFRA